MLGSDSTVTFEQKDDGLHVHLPEQGPGKYAYSFRIQFERGSDAVSRSDCTTPDGQTISIDCACWYWASAQQWPPSGSAPHSANTWYSSREFPSRSGAGCPGGDTVRLYFAVQDVATTCDWQGRWLVVLAPMNAGGPYQLPIEIGGLGRLIPSPAANSRGGIELNDVVAGEVWVFPWQFAPASGATKNGKNGSFETAVAPCAWIRVFKTPARTAEGPQPATRWTVALPGSPGIYSGASYSFARELFNRLGVPIGVIDNSARP